MSITIRKIEDDPRCVEIERKLERIRQEIQKTSGEVETVNRKRRESLEARVSARLNGEAPSVPPYDSEADLEELRGVLDILNGELRKAEEERAGIVATIKGEIAEEMKVQFAKMAREHVTEAVRFAAAVQRQVEAWEAINNKNFGLKVELITVARAQPFYNVIDRDSPLNDFLKMVVGCGYIGAEEVLQLVKKNLDPQPGTMPQLEYKITNR